VSIPSISGGAVVIYDISDIGTLWQDTAGTTPVTTVGQSVARVDDISGNGRNLIQATAGSRPTYQVDSNGKPYLLMSDGSGGRFMATASAIDLSSVGDKSLICMGWQKDSDAASGWAFDFSTSNAGTGAIDIRAPQAVTAGYSSIGGGTAESTVQVTTGYAAPVLNLISVVGDIAAPRRALRLNAVEVSASANTLGTGNYGNHSLFIGRRSDTTFANARGRFYGLWWGVRSSSAYTLSEINDVETWVGSLINFP
jgi:hypothetical protein